VKLGFFLREALRSLRRNAAPSFAALTTVLVTMLVIGIFIPIVQATTGAANDVRKRVLVNVFLKTDAKPKDVQRVKALIEETPHAGKVLFVTRDQAFREQRKAHPALYELLGKNPLPDTFRVTPDQPGNALELKEALAPPAASGGTSPRDPAIASVRNRQDDTRKILTITNAVKYTMAALAAILGLASILLIANTIRLSLFARRREVEVMKLVGATDWFIRWPFMVEGLVVGAAGSVLAIVLLGAGKLAVLDPLAGRLALFAAPRTIAFVELVVIIVVAGTVLSAAGSGLSLRRFLRV
jgi:cell division transport system permease protein